MRSRLVAIACLASLAAAEVPAALVDADFSEIKETAVGQMFISCLQPAHAEGTAPDADPPIEIKRLLVSWEGVKAPPVIRFIGVDASAVTAHLAEGKAPTQTSVGPSWALPNLNGFAVAMVKPDELVVSTPAALEKLQLPDLPQASGHVLQFTGPASDLKLGELQDKLKDFVLIHDHNGVTKVSVHANDEKDAKAVDRWIWWRKPVVFAGADVGVKKLKFPAKLLDQTDIARHKDTITASTTLKDDMRSEAFIYLADAIRREVRRFQPH
jgi:hypothetical protein